MKKHSCCKCKKSQDWDRFQLYKNKPSGWCRGCRTECEKKRRIKNGIKPKKFSRIENNKKLCMNCHEFKEFQHFSAVSRGLGGLCAYCRPCHIKRYKNKAKSREYTRAYREKHKERWRALHRLHQYKRRFKIEAQSDGTVNDEFLKEIYARTQCFYCTKQTPEDQRTIEHKTPLSRGGPHSIHNIEMACKSCNFTKRKLTENEYRSKTGV